MKALSRFSALVATSMILPTYFSFAGDEMVQLHSQVQGLAEQVSRLERALDENIGVTMDLLNRNAETTHNMERDAEQLQHHLEQQNKMADTQVNKISEEIKTWQTELSNLEARLDAATRAPLTPIAPQTLSSESSTPSNQTASVSPQRARAYPSDQAHPFEAVPVAAPQAESAGGIDLYRSAMDHYASKDFEIAATEFAKFLKTDPQSENATNARYYLAEIEYEDKDFEGALDDYTAVGPRLSDPARSSRAQYRKALCLIEVDRQDEAILELEDVIARYPRSVEAAQSAKKLRALKGRGAIHP
jgi:TolA-binding protein